MTTSTDGTGPVSAGLPFTAADVTTYVTREFPGTGNECLEITRTHAAARHVIEPLNLRPGGFVSGPTQFALADAALWYLAFGAAGEIEAMALTSELSIRFLRPAVGDVLYARADLHAFGRRNIVGSVTLWMDDRNDKPVSVGQGTYVRPNS